MALLFPIIHMNNKSLIPRLHNTYHSLTYTVTPYLCALRFLYQFISSTEIKLCSYIYISNDLTTNLYLL